MKAEQALGLREEVRKLPFGAIDPLAKGIPPYVYLEPASVIPQNLNDGLKTIEEKVLKARHEGLLPVVRIIEKLGSVSASLADQISSRAEFAGIGNQHIASVTIVVYAEATDEERWRRLSTREEGKPIRPMKMVSKII